jgi:mono/diheme cytochrome c family protein
MTVACPGGGDAPMYIAYFDASGDSNIKVGTETQTAPLRMGEIAALEFTITTAGQVKYDTACASCHAAGGYDTTTSGSAGDLYGRGGLIITSLSSLSGMSSVPDITSQEVVDLQAFLGSISPP